MKESKAFLSPVEIKLSEWRKILYRTLERVGKDNISIASAGVAFFIFLAIFPALLAVISIYGLALDPQVAQEQIRVLKTLVPDEAYSIIAKRIENLLETPGYTLGWGTIFGILVSLWSANNGTKAVFIGLDIAYKSKNKRGFIKQNAFTLFFTLGAFFVLILSMGLIVILPAIELYGYEGRLTGWLRWPLLGLIVVSGLSLLYKYAPDRDSPNIIWVVMGAALSTLLWLIASWGFSYLVGSFGRYGEVYGSISAVVILLFWLYISSYIILFGAELNSVTEEYAQNSPG